MNHRGLTLGVASVVLLVSLSSAAQTSPESTVSPRPRRGLTLGFAVGGGYGAFRLRDPVKVKATLQRTTTSGNETTTITVNDGEWPVQVRGSGPALAVNARLGYLVTPRLAVLVDGAFDGVVWSGPDVPREQDGWTISPRHGSAFEIALGLHVGAAAQVFLTERLWLRAGAGLGVVTYQADSDDTQRDGASSTSLGLGVLAGLGWELTHTATATKNRAMTLEAQFIGGPMRSDAYNYGATLGLGFQIY